MCPSLPYRQKLLSSLKTTKRHSTLQSTLSRYQSIRVWRCRCVSGSLAKGIRDLSSSASRRFPRVLDDIAGAACARISSLDTSPRSHHAQILMCICSTRPSRTWSIGVGMIHRPLLTAATHYRYTVPNMRSNPSICPSSFPQAYNATQFKWPNCDNKCKMLGSIYRRITFGTFMTVCMHMVFLYTTY